MCSFFTKFRSKALDLPRNIVNFVTSKIVGESNFQWNSEVCYFPTIYIYLQFLQIVDMSIIPYYIIAE